MRTKRKISLTIDANLYNSFEEAAKTYKMPKSQLVQEAIKCWLKIQTEALMSRGYEEMAEEDKAFAKVSLEAQKEILT